MSIFVIGKNGLLGQSLKIHKDWQFLSHTDAVGETSWIKNASCIINCAFSPALRTGPHQEDEDLDLKLARLVQEKSDCHYIMLSSRAVYGVSDVLVGWIENDTPTPISFYARNKLLIEHSLQNLLPNRLTILRLATMFGYELHRTSFFGLAMTGLKEHNTITLDMRPDVPRDFFPVWRFADAMRVIAGNPQAGIYNLGSGHGTQCGNIASWLIAGYGQGEIVSAKDYKDPFYLNMGKTYAAWTGLHKTSTKDIREDTLLCGRWLADAIRQP